MDSTARETREAKSSCGSFLSWSQKKEPVLPCVWLPSKLSSNSCLDTDTAGRLDKDGGRAKGKKGESTVFSRSRWWKF